MTPTAAYNQLNRLLWYNRLPKAVIRRVEHRMMPLCYGLTIQDNLCSSPIILLNASNHHCGRTLVHEMIHIAEPHLRHGLLFERLVNLYWHVAKTHIKGLDTL